MSKYSNEFKLKVVNYCLENNVGYRRAANYFNIPSKTLVERWVQKYKKYGPAGLFKNPTTIYICTITTIKIRPAILLTLHSLIDKIYT